MAAPTPRGRTMSMATTDVVGDLQVFIPLSAGLSKLKTDGVKFTTLMSTTDKAIAKNSLTDSDSIQNAISDTNTIKKESGDEQGKFALGLIAKNSNKGVVAAFGSVYTFTDQMNQQISGRNATLFSDVFAYLLPSDSGTSVSIPSKSIDATTLAINASSIRIFGLLFGIFLPLALIVYGIVVCIVRKRR